LRSSPPIPPPDASRDPSRPPPCERAPPAPDDAAAFRSAGPSPDRDASSRPRSRARDAPAPRALSASSSEASSPALFTPSPGPAASEPPPDRPRPRPPRRRRLRLEPDPGAPEPSRSTPPPDPPDASDPVASAADARRFGPAGSASNSVESCAVEVFEVGRPVAVVPASSTTEARSASARSADGAAAAAEVDPVEVEPDRAGATGFEAAVRPPAADSGSGVGKSVMVVPCRLGARRSIGVRPGVAAPGRAMWHSPDDSVSGPKGPMRSCVKRAACRRTTPGARARVDHSGLAVVPRFGRATCEWAGRGLGGRDSVHGPKRTHDAGDATPTRPSPKSPPRRQCVGMPDLRHARRTKSLERPVVEW
jgi:hypothetical protein